MDGDEVSGRAARGVVEDLDAAHAEICAAQRRLLGLIAEADRRKVWLASGARDLPHWLAMRHGISNGRPGDGSPPPTRSSFSPGRPLPSPRASSASTRSSS